MYRSKLKIKKLPFDVGSLSNIEKWSENNCPYGSNWPVVYLIHNNQTKEAYIGETLNACKRAAQHLTNEERKRLSLIHIMTEDTFNKSVILDLESFLIKYMSADNKYKLQNGNAGLVDFNYYKRDEYEKEFINIWDQLKELGLVQSNISDISQSDLFKYSPYKSLKNDQQNILSQILYVLNGAAKFNSEETILVEGGAGTGKTILAIFLIKLLEDAACYDENIDIDDNCQKINSLLSLHKKWKIGFVVPMQSIRKTIQKVFGSINGLSSSMVLSPNEVVKQGPFDLLVVDEAHRLHQRKCLSQYATYDKNNKKLGLDSNATELDWIIKSSKNQLLFYDKDQTVRPSDISVSNFSNTINQRNSTKLKLTSQLRCLGGNDYIQYVKNVLNVKENLHRKSFENYDLKFYDDLDEMVDEINNLNETKKLSCVVAGYAWEWKTKKHNLKPGFYDIEIGKGYIWNRTVSDWINSDRLPNEIGCIHTVQGYDLNYAGVIFGPEITYSKESNQIKVIRQNYKDYIGKQVGNDYELLKKYIINIYCTLMTRGIMGTYVYVCDKNLKEYLRTYF